MSIFYPTSPAEVQNCLDEGGLLFSAIHALCFHNLDNLNEFLYWYTFLFFLIKFKRILFINNIQFYFILPS
jgi:hypothetical protein